MSIILFSIYYPLNKRLTLIRDGIIPLLSKIDYEEIDYFLSTYKGENVTIMVNGDYSRITNIIHDHFVDFFAKNHVKIPSIILPTERLFLDFAPNTLQFWEHNPFKKGHRDLDKIEISEKSSFLSNECLKILLTIDQWDEHTSFNIYLNILFDLIRFFGNKTNLTNLCLAQIEHKLKSRLYRKEEVLDAYFAKGKAIFRHNKNSILEHFEESALPLNVDEFSDTTKARWIHIFRSRYAEQEEVNTRKLISDIASIVLDSIQKIDLDPSGLIMALGVASSLTHEQDMV